MFPFTCWRRAGAGARHSSYTMRLLNTEIWMIALGCLSTMFVIVVVHAEPFGPGQACMDFAAGALQPSSWTLADCTAV